MRKKRVLSFFAFLGLFVLGLAAFNVISSGSLTGRVIAGEDYTQELFSGSLYEFKYYPSSFKQQQDLLDIQGNLVELAGADHDLQMTVYMFGVNDDVIGTYSREAFLGASSQVGFNLRIPAREPISKVILYVEDERTTVRIYKEMETPGSALTGRVIAEIDANGRNYGSFLAGLFIFASLAIFAAYKISEYNKSIRLGHALNHKQGRHFIDLDVR